MNCVKKEAHRKVYLDFIRIVAIFMVLFNHTNENGFVLFLARRDSMFYWAYLFNAILIKTAVPLFFMVSGALLLGKNENYPAVLKRFFRFFIVLFVASVLMYFYRCFRLKTLTFSMLEFLKMFYKEPVSGALWYLYTYLAFILMLPLLRVLAQNMNKAHYVWMAVMVGLISLLPLVEFFVWKNEIVHYYKFSFFIATEYIFYPLMGYYLDRYLTEASMKTKNLWLLIGASCSSILVCGIATHLNCSLINEWNESTCQKFFGTLIFIPSIMLFFAIKMLFTLHPIGKKGSNIIKMVGQATFGVYLLEYICRYETEFVFNSLNNRIPTLIACWIWMIVACALGVFVTIVVKKIPGMNRFI